MTLSRLVLAGGMMLPVLATGAAMAAPASNAAVNTSLTCGTVADGNTVLPTTNIISAQGSDVSLQVGLNINHGGVATQFILGNRNVAGATVDVLEGRSTAGKGMQFQTFFRQGDNQTFTFRQGAGNAATFQWGTGNNYVGGDYYLNAIDWTPIINDTYNGQATSPCPGNSGPFLASVDNGALDIAAAPIPTSAGNAISMTAAYTLQSKFNQYWWSSGMAWQAQHAFNLSRVTATNGDLRFYLGTRGGSVAGPYRIHQDGEVARLAAENPTAVVLGSNGSDVNRNESALVVGATGRYAAFVWNLWGQDTVVVVPNVSNGGTLLKSGNSYPGLAACPNGTTNAFCGSMTWLTNILNAPGSYQIEAGGQRQLASTYYIGTKAQVTALGYPVP